VIAATDLFAIQTVFELTRLPGRLILDSFGRTLAEVREVKECVLLDASFSSLKARTLDDNTPK
tara:strand:- start:1598 stop:1786 length:189 start_codon:yes stop_codon:yes gene_type:complete